MTAYMFEWVDDDAAWVEAARFFAQIISQDPAYISHGEIQTGLSLDGATWVPDLEQRFLTEATGGDDSRSLALARAGDGTLVGAAVLSWDFETPDAPFATLQDMAVLPERRSHGIGADLVAFAEKAATARGAKWLFLESGKNNLRAHQFFERSGFAEISHVFAKRVG